MRKLIVLIITLVTLDSYGQEPYQVTVDLTATQRDKVPVTIEVPTIDTSYVEYHMAKVVPGTYSVSDFGRFVTDFEALDQEGNPMEVRPLGQAKNIYRIENANELKTIRYWVHDGGV